MSDLPAEIACQQVLQRMFHSIDLRDYETVAQQFVAEPHWVRQGQTLKSRPEIVAAMKARPESLFTFHILTSVWVESTGADKAKARAYMTVFRKDSGKVQTPPLAMTVPDMIVVTNAEFRREGGRWLISKLGTEPGFLVKPAS